MGTVCLDIVWVTPMFYNFIMFIVQENIKINCLDLLYYSHATPTVSPPQLPDITGPPDVFNATLRRKSHHNDR